MKEIIQEKLKEVELQYGVEVMYACESGSRAWGFASTDSDYDVRFIYCSPLSEYLSIREKKDVIELPVNEILDIGGWDLKKTLQLFIKSNAALYEWLQSPIVYRAQDDFAQELRNLMPLYYSGRAACHHYLSMARNTFLQDLQGEQVNMKKYLYALRPLLAMQWIVEKGEVPPMEFHQLRTLVEDRVWQSTVDELLYRKSQGTERDTISSISLLQQWISTMLSSLKEKADVLPPKYSDHQLLDKVFQKYIGNDIRTFTK